MTIKQKIDELNVTVNSTKNEIAEIKAFKKNVSDPTEHA